MPTPKRPGRRGGLLAAVSTIAVLVVMSCASPPADQAAPAKGPRARAPVPRRMAPPAVVRRMDAGRAAVVPENTIDLTRSGAVVWGTAQAEIIDTASFEPQVQAGLHWDGVVRDVEEMLPSDEGKPAPQVGVRNSLPVGGLLDATRVAADVTFPGLDLGDSGGWQPPDCTLAVGPDYIVTTVNMAIGFFAKDGTLEFSVPLNDTGSPGFFEPVGAQGFTFDPKCYYDHYSGRFVVIAPEVYSDQGTAWMDIAVSDDSNPHGLWYKYRTNCTIQIGSDTFWLDYPGLGFDQDGIYVTGNLFGLNNSGWGGVLFRIFDKAPLLNGDPASYADLRDGGAGSVQVAQVFGDNLAPLFVSVENNSQLRVQAITDPLTSPALHTTLVNVPYFDYIPGDPPNSGGSVWTFDSRIMNVHWRDGDLYAGHHIGVDGRNVARWYHLQTNDWPDSGSVTYVESGNIDEGGSRHTYFPAIYSNQYGSVALVCASSTWSTTPEIHATGRTAGDPPGTMATPTVLKVSPSGADGRWGDYFDVAVDPTNDTTFWVIGEYQDSSGWSTWITSFSVTTCPGDLNADGTIDLADLSILLANYGQSGRFYDDGDFDGDGVVDLSDLSELLAVYGTNCP